MMADPGFIAERRDRLVGLVITHAHEDHIGAVAWLWPQLRCPVYATPFAAAVLRRKLGEVQLQRDVKLHVIEPGGADRPRALRADLRAGVALDPRGAGADHPHAARHDPAHRGFQARPEAAGRPDHRRGGAGAARRGGRAGDGVRFHQRDGGGPFRVGGGGAAEPVRADPRHQGPGGGDVLREQCRPRGDDRLRRARRGAQRRPGRTQPAQPRRRGARVRLSPGRAGVRPGGRGGLDPGRQFADPHYRQPGRAAQRAGPRRDGHASEHRARRGRHGDFQQPDDPRQRAGDRHGAGQSGPSRRAADDGHGPSGACLRPSRARRVAQALSAGQAALRGAGAWRVAASVGARGAGAGGGGHADAARGWRHPAIGARSCRGDRQRAGRSAGAGRRRGWCR